jgi:hypothetical protein
MPTGRALHAWRVLPGDRVRRIGPYAIQGCDPSRLFELTRLEMSETASRTRPERSVSIAIGHSHTGRPK